MHPEGCDNVRQLKLEFVNAGKGVWKYFNAFFISFTLNNKKL